MKVEIVLPPAFKFLGFVTAGISGAALGAGNTGLFWVTIVMLALHFGLILLSVILGHVLAKQLEKSAAIDEKPKEAKIANSKANESLQTAIKEFNKAVKEFDDVLNTNKKERK